MRQSLSWSVVVMVAGALACGGPAGTDGGGGGGGASDAGFDGGTATGGGTGGGGASDAGLVDAGGGCSAHAACTSGSCDLGANDCFNCQDDGECSGEKVCGTGACHLPCSVQGDCAAGWACCGNRCVDPSRDPRHCGQCSQVCPEAATFCATGACVAANLSGVCLLPVATLMLDGQAADDAATQQLGDALLAQCDAGLTTRTVGQRDAGVLSIRDGRPLQLGELLVMGGGSFRQEAVRWLEAQGVAPVRDASSATEAILRQRDGGVVVRMPFSDVSAARDLLVVQLVAAPLGPVVLNAWGFEGTGTAAAATYFVERVLPARATLTDAWMVVEWVDANANGVAESTEFTVRGSGP